ncbi:MAG: hypothetical protein ACLT98_10375 [Eggerthellaceae bacterium]
MAFWLTMGLQPGTMSVAFDFFDGKGVLESIARELALPKVRFRPVCRRLRICSPAERPRS